MELNPLTLLEKAINEHGSSAILKERIELVKDLLAKVEREKLELEQELVKTRQELSELKKRQPGDGYVAYRGAKFKRKPSGGYEASVYCPSCEIGMATITSANMPFTCGKCHALSGFTSRDLQTVLSELATEYPA